MLLSNSHGIEIAKCYAMLAAYAHSIALRIEEVEADAQMRGQVKRAFVLASSLYRSPVLLVATLLGTVHVDDVEAIGHCILLLGKLRWRGANFVCWGR